ncbi:MAG: hypothetical protein QXJ27_02545 [Thermoplasmata archaeon]
MYGDLKNEDWEFALSDERPSDLVVPLRPANILLVLRGARSTLQGRWKWRNLSLKEALDYAPVSDSLKRDFSDGDGVSRRQGFGESELQVWEEVYL